MKAVCIVPIKGNSERCNNKNIRKLGGQPLFVHMLSHILQANCFADIYVDTDIDIVKSYAMSKKIKVIDRRKELTYNNVNGNDLLNYHFSILQTYDLYFQLFVTAPFLKADTIRYSVDFLKNNCVYYDSCLTARRCQTYYWFNGKPVNYQPIELPRSQDTMPLYEETTGLYGITKKSLAENKCRIGQKTKLIETNYIEGIDINTEDDFKLAEVIYSNMNKL